MNSTATIEPRETSAEAESGAGVGLHAVVRQPVKHIVALSGGKDSTAMALRLIEVEPRDYSFVCTPTKNELPEMTAHWDRMECLLGKPLIRLPGKSLVDLILMFKALPNNRHRWCTRMLKIEPYIAYVQTLGEAVSYVGLRADEDRLGAIYDDIKGIKQDYPFKRWGWTLENVVNYLREQGVKIPKRTDCAWCYDQQIGEWWELWMNHKEIWMEGEKLEEETGHTFRSPSRDSWPASMKELRLKFESGLRPRGAGVLKLNFDEPEQYQRCRACRM